MRPPLALADLSARAMRLLDPEIAHRLTVRALATGRGPAPRIEIAPSLATKVAGIEFPNPLGLAAGFDKNAEAANGMLELGFGFVEIGAVTPRPQAGNARPRVFRLTRDLAVINRYGFNNDGLERIAARLRRRERRGIVGANLGANKDARDKSADYVAGLEGLAGLVDFFTVNVSSPNTPGLRGLQSRAALEELMTRVLAARAASAAGTPVFLKVAPDLSDEDKADIGAVVRKLKINGLVVSNTTIARPADLNSPFRDEAGGLSGAPLMGPSTRLLAEFSKALGAATPLIGVGGVFSARDAYRKILSGASLVQLYTALVYAGPSLVKEILEELPQFLAADGFQSVAEAVGRGV